ncbi:MAG: M48 family peptidase, partial [Methanobacteriota archaeon]
MAAPSPAPETVVERRQIGTIRLRVLPDGTLRVTAPPGVDVSPFIQRRSNWIARKRQEIARIAADAESLEHPLIIDGEPYRLVHGDTCSVDAGLHEVTYTTPAALKRLLATRWRQELAAAVA